MNSSAPLHVLVSVSDGYRMPLSVMLTSLFASNPASDITVWLLYADLSADARMQLRAQVEAAGAQLESIPVDDARFADYPTAPYITHETYLRLLSGNILPETLHRVLWLDADLVVRGSLRPLYDRPFGDAAVIACNHGLQMEEGMYRHCLELGLNPAAYVNAGVMLFNLDAWRAMDVLGRIERIVARGIPLKYADQDLVNIIFAEHMGLADEAVFNFRTNRDLPDDSLERARNEACIVHYCGKMKPWMFSDIPLGDIWREQYERSPYGGRPLRLISRAGLSRLAQRAKGGMKQ